eukprot:RCo016140
MALPQVVARVWRRRGKKWSGFGCAYFPNVLFCPCFAPIQKLLLLSLLLVCPQTCPRTIHTLQRPSPFCVAMTSFFERREGGLDTRRPDGMKPSPRPTALLTSACFLLCNASSFDFPFKG